MNKRHIPRLLAALTVFCLLGFFLYSTLGLTSYTDPYGPQQLHVSPRYIELPLEETGSPNMVTAVLADYRGFDTLGETTVIFTAGVVTFLLVLVQKKKNIFWREDKKR